MCRDTLLLKRSSNRQEKYRIREAIPEFTSKGDERMNMVVNSMSLDSIGMGMSRKSCTVGPR